MKRNETRFTWVAMNLGIREVSHGQRAVQAHRPPSAPSSVAAVPDSVTSTSQALHQVSFARCLSALALAGIPAPAQLRASLLGPDTWQGGTPGRQLFGSDMPRCRDFPVFSVS